MSSNPQITIGITATDQARHVLQQVDQKIAGTTSVVEQNAAKIQSKTAAMSTALRANFANIATSVAGLSAGIVGFATSFSTLEKAQASATTAQITYEKSAQSLEKLRASGKASAEKLATAEAEVANNLEKVRIAQGNVSDVYTNFLAQVPSQLLSFGIAGSAIMKTLGISHAAAGASATGQAGATNLLNASLLRTVGAAIAARAAMIAAFIATPIGAVITAASIVVGLFAFNVGGLRDRIFELGNAIMAFLRNHFRPLHDAILWFINNVAKPLGNFFGNLMPSSVDTAQNSLASFDNSIVNTGTGITNFETTLTDMNSMLGVGVPVAANSAVAAFATLERASTQTAQSIETSSTKALTALEKLGAAQNRAVVTQFGRQVGLAGTVSVDAAIAAGFGSNEAVMSSAKAGRLGGVFVAGKGRVLAHGGTLFEDVIGFGTRTGTPHMLHAGEDVIPRGQSGGPLTIVLEIDGRAFAQATLPHISEALTRKRTIHMRITHEAIHGTM